MTTRSGYLVRTFILTAEQREAIRHMEAEKVRLEKVIVDAQRALIPLNDRLHAVAILAGPQPNNRPEPNGTMFDEKPKTETPAPTNMTEVVEKIANTSSDPVPRKQLRETLLAQGFTQDRLGNYFYIVIHRLKKKKRITINEDGSVGPAPAP